MKILKILLILSFVGCASSVPQIQSPTKSYIWTGEEKRFCRLTDNCIQNEYIECHIYDTTRSLECVKYPSDTFDQMKCITLDDYSILQKYLLDLVYYSMECSK
jgi:hypothetical protein